MLLPPQLLDGMELDALARLGGLIAVTETEGVCQLIRPEDNPYVYTTVTGLEIPCPIVFSGSPGEARAWLLEVLAGL